MSPSDDRFLLVATLGFFQQQKRPRLRFAPDLEQKFQIHYAQRYQLHIQIAGFMGLLALLAATPWDYWTAPQLALATWHIRISSAILLIFSLIFSFSSRSRPYQQHLITLNTLVNFTTVYMISDLLPPPMRDYYAIGSTLILLGAFVISRLQYRWGRLAAIGMTIILLIHSIRHHIGLELTVIQFYVLALGIAFCLPGTYLMERMLRLNYLQSQVLSHEHQTLEKARMALEVLTSTDGLTHIANRRSFDNNMLQEWNRQQRAETPMALLLIDVDHFKKYNDLYGHPAGDQCLIRIAQTLKSFARRPGDLAARYGGEEFALLLPDTRLGDAEQIGRKLLSAMSELKINHERSNWGQVTISIGAASMIPTQGIDAEQLLLRADEALYEAKQAGRNTLRCYAFTRS